MGSLRGDQVAPFGGVEHEACVPPHADGRRIQPYERELSIRLWTGRLRWWVRQGDLCQSMRRCEPRSATLERSLRFTALGVWPSA
jgi:hypothetical protein